MPILLKDNIGTQGMKTTAGSIALVENQTDDAFIVERLKEKGALILGKANLSEWANFICDCPNGQSAIGGQTLNPYGRRIFDTGGSSSGSGASVAANYAVAAVGTETSGSILSPSSQSSNSRTQTYNRVVEQKWNSSYFKYIGYTRAYDKKCHR